MPKKKQEITGKPTHYNLHTMEYDWKHLPDGHLEFEVPEQRRLSRPVSISRENEQVHIQKNMNQEAEPVFREPAPLQVKMQDRNDYNEIFDNSPAQGNPYPNARNNEYFSGPLGKNRGEETPPPEAPPTYFIIWSHEDIKRVNQINYVEARHSYYH
ncbi:hypothetical protein STCU_05497 [Strigomonas culicis]|uniref:Uncharacterized protein n=1 Tax=Strigomonas culicis TaxID=28005 RepID=S9VHV8_9TRYP|nr:hypothetical protein STCU_06138 [Strigomonas culicis]EPY27841.1 hypothetical protein STCU_05497 [Strigomonas culicis]|eukprot:EPY26671.1 hypothetical protein STCU_06138 [Strigomonas culicis]